MAKNVEAARELNVDATRIVSEEAGTYCLLAIYVHFFVFLFVYLLLKECSKQQSVALV